MEENVFILLLPAIIVVVLVQLTLIVLCLVDLLKKSKTKYLNKAIWILIVLFTQMVGPIIYLVIEKGHEDEDNRS